MEKVSAINSTGVEYVYSSKHTSENQQVKALSGINLSIGEGEFVVVLGRNGSGKSTLARLFNALLLPTQGVVYVNALDTCDDERLWEIRRSVGMVFQNPDNQIVGTVVEEDVAFGPENIGIAPAEIRKRVYEALETVDMIEYRNNAPAYLSGGQKQRVAIAGILAMKPACIVLDEATSMLDPEGRKDVMAIMKKLNKQEGMTIVHITHHMDEAQYADRVIIIDKGRIALTGSPKKVFSNVEMIKKLGLDVPQVTELLHELQKEGMILPYGILTVDDAFMSLCKVREE